LILSLDERGNGVTRMQKSILLAIEWSLRKGGSRRLAGISKIKKTFNLDKAAQNGTSDLPVFTREKT
jgi:hypothetical protein